ncbi:MAG: hypothetical protein ABIT37_16695 [Luteolibacter sp.]
MKTIPRFFLAAVLTASACSIRAAATVVPMPAMPGVPASSAYQLHVSGKEVAVMNTSQRPNLVFAATKGLVFVHQDSTGKFAYRGVSKLAGPRFAMMTRPIQPLHPLTFMDDEPAPYQRVINVPNCLPMPRCRR